MIQLRTRSATVIFCLLLLPVASGPMAAKESSSSSDLGLTVNARGTLTHNGAPYRGIGVNYYDAFLRVLRNPSDDSYKEGFAQLGAHGIPFARMCAGAFLPSDLQIYLNDKDAYFQRMDEVVQAAEKSHVGLIMSLFWELWPVSEVVHEPHERWGDANSQTRQLMRRYTADVVSRYANSPAIWGWEFSCELSLAFDHRQTLNPANAFSYETFRSAALDFAQTVRRIDPDRVLVTGNSLPRPSAYHSAMPGPVRPDTEEQFANILLRDNPGPFNTLCIHASPANIALCFADRRVDFQQLLEACVQIGQRARKPIYLEEFIPVPRDAGIRATTNPRDYFTRELTAIENSGVPLASVWVYDRKLAPDNRNNLTFDNERSYMLRMIADFDQSVHAQQ